jgi:hypothetical protein
MGNEVDSVLDLWDNIDKLTFYLPMREAKDKSFRILVSVDPEYEGMYMLRAFLCKEDLNLFSSVYSKNKTYHTTASIEEIEFYMKRNFNSHQNIKLSRCVLCSIDINKIMREVETLWSYKNY